MRHIVCLLGLLLRLCLPCGASELSSGDTEWQCYRVQLQLLDKILDVRVMVTDLRSAPAWNPAESLEPPVAMVRAIEIAKKFLAGQGCAMEQYFLTSCTLKRVYRIKSMNHWYWEIEFAEKTSPASVYPTITIPVLMSGKIPEATLVRQKSKSKESRY